MRVNIFVTLFYFEGIDFRSIKILMEIDRGLCQKLTKKTFSVFQFFSYSSEPTSLSLHLHVKNIFNLSQLFLLMINRFDWNSRESKSISQHYLDIFFFWKSFNKELQFILWEIFDYLCFSKKFDWFVEDDNSESISFVFLHLGID